MTSPQTLRGKTDFRARVELAGDVVRVQSYIRRIAHLSGSGDVADHTLVCR